ncbi:MAG: transposase [Planctomycetota bacterium]
MPRRARDIIPNTPHHITQRGHNRLSVFAERVDYEYFLGNLFEWKELLDLKLHAWCLMTNHVHLIVEPGENPDNVGALMRRIAGRQTRWVNKLEGRTGTLWGGRYHASPIQTHRYLLGCSRYIELNPVRAKMTARPEDYEWSSYRAKIGLAEEPGLDLDGCYLGLGRDRSAQQSAYAAFVGSGISEQEYALIHNGIQRNQLTGDQSFVDEIERRIGKRIEPRGHGRPRRHNARRGKSGTPPLAQSLCGHLADNES